MNIKSRIKMAEKLKKATGPSRREVVGGMGL